MAEHDISAKGMRHVGLSCGSEGANTGGDESGNDSDRSGGVPEITVSALSADTLAALTAHLAVKDAIKVCLQLCVYIGVCLPVVFVNGQKESGLVRGARHELPVLKDDALCRP